MFLVIEAVAGEALGIVLYDLCCRRQICVKYNNWRPRSEAAKNRYRKRKGETSK